MKKSTPTPRQADRRRAQAAVAAERRSWRDDLAAKYEGLRFVARRRRAKEQTETPARYTGPDAPTVTVEYLIEHTGPTRAVRRRQQLDAGRTRIAPSSNVPYRNPERNLKRHARLRSELRAELQKQADQ